MKRWVTFCFGLGILGCGGATPPAQSTPKASSHLALAPDEFAERTDLANPVAPPNTSLWCHVPTPDKDVPVIGALTNLGAFLDLKSMLEQRLGHALTSALDLGRPFDVLAFKGVSDDDTRVAASVGVEDVPAFAAHTQKGYSLARLSAGRYRLVKIGAGDEPFKCELWQGAPAVGARLICANFEPEIELAGPFLISPERVNAKTASVHLEIPHEFIVSALRDLEKKDADEVDANASAARRAGEKLGHDEAFGMFNAIQSTSFDLTLHDDSVEVSQQLEIGPADGFLARMLAGRAGPHPLVPNAFWSLPSDSELALYSEGIDEPALRDAWRKLAPRLMAMSVDPKAAKPGQADEVSRLFEEAFIHAGALEIAYGQDLDADATTVFDVAERLKQKPPKAGVQQPPELASASRKLSGWIVFGAQTGERDEIAAIRAAVAAGNKLPTLKDPDSESSQRTHEKFSERPLKRAGKLPKGAVHLVIESTPNKKYKPTRIKPKNDAAPESPPLPSTYHLVAVQQNGQLWAALANDEGVAVRRVSQVLEPESQQSLGADPALKALAGTAPAALGFATTAGLVGASLSVNSLTDLANAQRRLNNMMSSPYKGGTRMPAWLTSEGNAPRRIALHVALPAHALADFLHFSLPELDGDK